MTRTPLPDPRRIDVNGTGIAVRTAGSGPAVLLLHGFPGTSFSWRHQIGPLVEAGFRAIVPDLRGYGASDRPEADCYPSATIVADLLGVLDALAVEQAHLVGQDFGSMYAHHLAQRHPERVRSVLGTVPFAGEPAAVAPSTTFAAVAERHFLHLHYFQAPGVAEQDLGGSRLAEFLRRLMWALSGRGELLSVFGHPTGTSYLDALPPAPPLPWPWLSEGEFATFHRAFASGGPGRELVGGLGGYRAADADWAQARVWTGTTIDQPSLLVMGSDDPVRTFAPPDLEQQRRWLTDLRDIVFVEQAGHFVQQEQPEAFTAILLRWLSEVGGEQLNR